MRIAVATDWFAPRRGGIEAQLLQLVERLAARRHTVDVLTSTPGAQSGTGFVVRPLDAHLLRGTSLALSPRLVGALGAALDQGGGYDVVHAHVSVVSPLGYSAVAAARARGIPVVLTFHSVLHLKRWLLRAMHGLIDPGGSPVVFTGVSELVAEQVGRAVGQASVTVLPNGVDLSWWSVARPSRAADAPLTFVAAARLHSKKRPVELVQAFANAVSGANCRARLTVFGDGPERERLIRLAADIERAVAGAAVEIRHWTGVEALRDQYAEADVFVTASLREAFGIAALEAAAAGLPVVAMCAAGSREFLTHERNALLCEDDAALAAAMRRLMLDDALRLRLTGAASSLERYGWPRVVDAHEAVYEAAMRLGRSQNGTAGIPA